MRYLRRKRFDGGSSGIAMPMLIAVVVAATCLGAATRWSGEGVETDGISHGDFDRSAAEAAFAELKRGLVGEWRGTVEQISKPVEATFYLAGRGTALVEDMRRLDSGSRMHTVYHLSDDDLRLTHYCTFGNQTSLRATSVRDGGKTVEFDLIDVANLSRSGHRYTHRMVVSLHDDDRASVTYVGLDEGEEGSLTAELTRVGGARRMRPASRRK